MMDLRSKILILIGVFISLSTISGNILAQNFPFGKITVEDGLSNNYVNCLLQDSFGFLWFGTDDGLNRYDGYDIKVFRNDPDDSTSLSDNIIWALHEDNSGYIWIGTKNGKLNRYNPATDKFNNWDLDSGSVKKSSITCIYEDKDNIIWIGTYRKGLYRYDSSNDTFNHWQNNNTSSTVVSDNFITSIVEDHHGNLWISTYNGLNRFNRDTPENPFTQIYFDSEEFDDLSTNLIWHLGKSKLEQNSIWMGTLKGLMKYYPETNSVSSLKLSPKPELQFSMSISSVTEEFIGQDTLLWIGTFGGLIRYNKSTGERLRFIHSKNNHSGIISNVIYDLMTDDSGVIWIATDNGLNFYSPKSTKFNFHFNHINDYKKLQEILNKNIEAVTQTSDGLTWFGTDLGLYNIKNLSSVTSLRSQKELNQLNTWCLFPGNSGKLWIGTYGDGLKELTLKTGKLKSWEIENPKYKISAYKYVKTILQDKNGMIWIGFWGAGLARLNPLNEKINYWRNEAGNPESLSYNDVWALCQDRKGRIWIGTNGGGLDLFDEKTGNKFHHWKATNNGENSLSSNSIYSICESIHGNQSLGKTVLWIGTGNGLNKFVLEDESANGNYSNIKTEISNYTVSNGLPDNSIECILEDENGNLWIGTSSGISFFNNEKEEFRNYDVTDGLKGNSINSNSAFKSSDGIMFFGSKSGLITFRPEQISQSDYSPHVLITNFQIFNKEVQIGDDSPLKTTIFNTDEINLSYNQNVFSFRFSALDFNSPQSIQYAYKMEGFDEDWIYSGTRRFVTYTNLDPGSYRFRVKATNSDGVWNNSETGVALVIKPPYWAMWWFRAIAILVFAGILYWLYRIRLKRILDLERLRVKIASDLHDDIGSALTRISVESELLDSNSSPDERKLSIKKIGNMSRDIISSMSDVVWSIDSRNDSIENLVNRMKDFAFSIFSSKNTRVIFEVNNLNLQKKLKVDIRQNIYLIFKEAINNAAKYSTSDWIKVIMKNKNGKFMLVIDDPVTTFSPEKLTGHGLRNIQMRTKRIGGKIEFSKESGFKIILTAKEL